MAMETTRGLTIAPHPQEAGCDDDALLRRPEARCSAIEPAPCLPPTRGSKMSTLLRCTALTGCTLLAMGLVVQTALPDGGRQPEILRATVEACPNDHEAYCLHLTGTRLHRGSDPVVRLSGSELKIHLLEGRGTTVFAELPEDMEPQTHVIELANRNGSASMEAPLTGTVAKGLPGYVLVTVQETIGSGGSGQAYADCPEPSPIVLGGGFSLPESGSISTSRPDGNGWQVNVLDATSGDIISATVICINESAFVQ